MNPPPSTQQTEYPVESYSVVTDCACSDPNCVPIAEHAFVWPERIVTVNDLIRMNWRPAAAFTAQWREAFKLMSNGCTPLAWCHVAVQYVHGSNRKMDVGAEAFAVKAALDGIVDGGVLPDDGPDYVRSATYHPAVYVPDEERLIVTLTGPAA